MKDIMLHGCGNTFLIVDEYRRETVDDKKNYVIKVASGKNVDGVLFLRKAGRGADLEMIIFDRDGTEETMCGNGIRCFAMYAYDKGYIKNKAKILTGDGIKKVSILENGVVAVHMGEPKEFRRLDEDNFFVFMGVSHYVSFVDKLDLDEARKRGREIRFDKELCSVLDHEEGINVNFVKVNSKNDISIMTYERGIEDVTKACGTGSTAAAFISHATGRCEFPVRVKNLGGVITIDCKNNRLIMTGKAEYL